MPAVDTTLFIWKNTQLSSGPFGLDNNIQKETELNEGGTVWSDRKMILKCCIAKSATISGRSSTQCSKHYAGIPAVGATLLNWKMTQLSKGPLGLDAKVEKENESNEGDTMWSDMKVRHIDCIVSKNASKKSAWTHDITVDDHWHPTRAVQLLDKINPASSRNYFSWLFFFCCWVGGGSQYQWTHEGMTIMRC